MLTADRALSEDQTRSRKAMLLSRRLNLLAVWSEIGRLRLAWKRLCSTSQVKTRVVESTNAESLQGFVTENTDPDIQIYTDEPSSCQGLDRLHETVCHSVGEYVREQASTNVIESLGPCSSRGHVGFSHRSSVKHLNRYVKEFEGRHNSRPLDTEKQMASIAKRSANKRLTYRGLIAGPNGENSVKSEKRRPLNQTTC